MRTWPTICVISIKEGSLQASAAPARALSTHSVAKLLQAACSIRKNPHMKMLGGPRCQSSVHFIVEGSHLLEAEVFAQGESLHQEVGREGPDEEAKVKHT